MNKDNPIVRATFGLGGMFGVQCVVGSLLMIVLKGYKPWYLVIMLFGLLLSATFIPTLVRWKRMEP